MFIVLTYTSDFIVYEDVLDTVEEEMHILHKMKERRVTGLVTPCVGTAL